MRPKLPSGVPALAGWEMTHSRGIGRTPTYLHLTLGGDTEADDFVYVVLGDAGLEGRAKVQPMRGRSEDAKARAREERLR